MSEEKRREYCWSSVIRKRLDRIDARLQMVMREDPRCKSGAARESDEKVDEASAFLQLDGIDLMDERPEDRVLGYAGLADEQIAGDESASALGLGAEIFGLAAESLDTASADYDKDSTVAPEERGQADAGGSDHPESA